jgi:hypothetical protein
MIYVTNNLYGSNSNGVRGVYELPELIDVKAEYLKYMVNYAKEEYNLIVSHSWLMACDHKNVNKHLDEATHKKVAHHWDKRVLKVWTIDYYIVAVLNAKKLDFNEIRF